MSNPLDELKDQPTLDILLHIRLSTLAQRLEAAQSGMQLGSKPSVKLGCAIHAVTAVRDFLRSIPTLDLVATPVDVLIGALQDVLEGRNAALFETKGSIGRKTSTEEQFLKIKTVTCCEVLRDAGMGAAEAREHIAKTWQALQIRQVAGENVRDIKASTIEGWENWARAQPVGSLAHEQQQFVKSKLRKGRSREEAIAHVHAVGEGIALWSLWESKRAPMDDPAH
jgi:hypothetical protein